MKSPLEPIIPKITVPIPQGMCFREMKGGGFENARVGAQNPSEITLNTEIPYQYCCAVNI